MEVREGRNQTCKQLVDNNIPKCVAGNKVQIQETPRSRTNTKAMSKCRNALPTHAFFKLPTHQRHQKQNKKNVKGVNDFLAEDQ